MPRSGSTLLQNILGNNPDIYATPTSGLIELLKESRKIYSSSPQFKAQDENQMKSAFLMYCRYGIEGYFNGLTDRKYAIDKSRGWAISYGFLKAFYPNPKIICMFLLKFSMFDFSTTNSRFSFFMFTNLIRKGINF